MEAYFVTTHHNLYRFDDSTSRTVGFFATLEEAKRIVENNICDIFESYYRHATIECIHDGLYPIDGSSEHTIFYEWNVITKKYMEIQKPKNLESFIGFSNIG